MIDAVKRRLADMGKTACIRPSLLGEEKGKSVNLIPRGAAIKIEVDGKLITDTKRCDCLYFYQHTASKSYVFAVELKGNNYPHALGQLEATLDHDHYRQLLYAAKPARPRKYAVAIVSRWAKINPTDKEKWENEHHHRLRVFARDNNEKSCELVQEIVQREKSGA